MPSGWNADSRPVFSATMERHSAPSTSRGGMGGLVWQESLDSRLFKSVSHPVPHVTSVQDPIRLILPLAINTNSLTPAALKSIFLVLNSMDTDRLPEILPPLVETPTVDSEDDKVAEGEAEAILDKETIYISIATPDSSVVYYKLAKGIKKPQDVPDE